MVVRRVLSLLSVGAVAATMLAVVGAPASAADPYTVTPLHFKTVVGPKDDTVCDVVGDLYLPRTARRTAPVPAILTTNGFGGSKDDQAGLGREFAARGYAVLSYSGLGFGGSDCKITLDDPDYDGKAASQLVSYLGGKEGIAFTDDAHTKPAPVLDVVRRDTKDQRGTASRNDPRVGMVGASYGGQVQYSAASVDPRIDTIIPIATWSDLSYSLSPNNTSQTTGVSTSTPGAAKLVWALGFSALGIVNGLQNLPTDPMRIIPCPNFADWVCPGLVTAGTLGAVDRRTTERLRHASVASYVSRVRIPTLIMQGQSDTLFNLNEATATYRALKKQRTPVKMVWLQGGHSGPTAPGEIDFGAPDPATQHLAKRVLDWFDHYLKGSKVGTGPEFTYFRDWVSYTGNASKAYASSSAYPAGTATKLYLGGTTLASSTSKVVPAAQSFLTPPAGLPTSNDVADVVGVSLPVPVTDAPGTFAAWSTPALTTNLDVVGEPTLDLAVSAPTAVLTQVVDAGKLTLFVKVVDVDAKGKRTVVRNLVAPVRVPDASKPFRVTLPGFAHRFAAGHRITLVVAGGSINYRGGLVPTPVTIAGGPQQVLTLPTVR